jgi:hypothetical protein
MNREVRRVAIAAVAMVTIAVLLGVLWRDRTTALSVGSDHTPERHSPETAGSDISAASDNTDDHCITSVQSAASSDVPDAIIDRDTYVIRERLLQSQDPEHLAAAALFADSAADQVADITKALAAGPGNAMLLSIAVQICDDAIDAVECPLEHWEDELLRVDGQNRHAWIRVATNRMRRGEPQAAFEAMQRAASALETRAYWQGTLAMLDRARVAAGDYQLSDHEFRRMAADNIPAYEAYAQMCRQQSEASAAWADVCLRNESAIKAAMQDLQTEIDSLMQGSGSAECKRSNQGS